jgi:hypothetical protein
MAAAGIEANFEQDGVEYRLGAERHTIDDYLSHVDDVGFRDVRWQEFRGDSRLAEEVPQATRYLDQPLLLVIQATRPVAT